MIDDDPADLDGPGEDATPPVDPNLGKRAVRGAAVTVAGQAGKIGLQMLSVIVLARLLTPGEYGLIAMVAAIIGVADIFRDFGLSSAAIQAPTLSRVEQSNLFWVNTALGGLLAKWGGPEVLFSFTTAIAVLWLWVSWPLRPVARS